MGLLVVNSDFERLWNEPMPTISFDNATYSLAGEVGTTLSASFAIFDNKDVDVTGQCEITLDNDNVSIEDGMFVCDDLEVGTYQTIATATYSYKSATVTATATINISVEEEKPTSISFDSNSYSLSGTEGETITESFTVTDNLSNDVTALCSYSFSPNDTGITASNGTFDASSVLAGTYSVTVTATYGELTTTATISMDIAASHDYSKEYFTTEALESGTFTLNVPTTVTSSYMTSVSYSTDDGQTWTDTTIDSTNQNITTPTINAGDKVLWKGVGSALNGSKIISTGNFNASGNIMSLLYGDNFVGQTSFVADNACYRLFMSNSKIVSAEDLVLPATTLKSYCYQQMFLNCSSLTTAPTILPATNLGDNRIVNVYTNMFKDCTSLTTAPALPATTLVSNCYKQMFQGCTSLTTAPTLPATTLVSNCYEGMFYGCTSLTTLPSGMLPATTLQSYCYLSMFKNCTSLTTVPSDLLPATTLAQSCYGGHSGGTQTSYDGMFTGCTSLTTAPELPATTLVNNCYEGMFYGCTNLSSITMLATDISAYSCLFNWVQGVAATGTFTKDASMTTLPTGANGIPSGWTVVDAS